MPTKGWPLVDMNSTDPKLINVGTLIVFCIRDRRLQYFLQDRCGLGFTERQNLDCPLH